MKLSQKFKNIGPGVLVTAAFIGPGTITTCSITGASFGNALLWGLTFSIIATLILQEMTARLGIIGRRSLGEAIRLQFAHPISRFLSVALVLSAIFIGNAAYETGNILGASMGMIELSGISKIQLGNLSISIWGPIIGIVAFLILEIGSYKKLERSIIVLVLLMSLAFISTAIVLQPDLLSILKGTFVPTLPKGSIYIVMGLIGTTVVPYNLFLHSSSVQKKWNDASHLKDARYDLLFSVLLGGFISMSVIITAATSFYGTSTEIKGASDLAQQLTPLLGNWAGFFMALGLAAAGISSAITAPLAAAFATSGILGFPSDFKNQKFKWIWRSIILIGILFSAIGYNPIKAIVFAQFANAILLPLVAIFLLFIMNNKQVLKTHSNSRWQNIGALLVVLITLGLGIKSLIYLFERV